MRILVLSDSHRRTSALFDAVEAHPDIKHVIFLGDGVNELDDVKLIYSDRNYYSVSGNCDFSSALTTSLIIKLEGKVIYACHGHLHGVKYGLDRAVSAAKQAGADILLFGHTHVAMTSYSDGLYIMNPGSVSQPRDGGRPSYGIIDIVPQGIMTNIIR